MAQTIYHFKVKVFHIENIWHRRVVINMSFVCHVVENTKLYICRLKFKFQSTLNKKQQKKFNRIKKIKSVINNTISIVKWF